MILLRVFGLFCAIYYSANLVFRWAHWNFFDGHGAYGWHKPTTCSLLAMFMAVLASSLLAFYWPAAGLDTLSRRWPPTARRYVHGAAYSLLVMAVSFAEADAAWFSLSKEHLRWSDVRIVLESNPISHFGLSIRQFLTSMSIILVHVPVLLVAFLLLRGAPVPSMRLLTSGSAALALAAFTVIAMACSAHLAKSNKDQWASIAGRNLYDLSLSRLIRHQHPDAAALNEELQRALSVAVQAPATRPVPQSPVRPLVDHVLIIAIEGWNQRFFDAETMPFLQQLSERFQVHTQHYSSGNNTLLGMLGITYGQTPALFFEQAAIGARSLALREFSNAGFSARRYGHGLLSYRNIESYFELLVDGGDGSSEDYRVSFRAIAEHAQSQAHSLSIYYYADSHFPYRHSPQFSKFMPEVGLSTTLRAGTTPDEVQTIVNRYRNALHEADSRLRELFQSLDWTRMAVVITGDHGESMMETGRLSHSSSLERHQVGTPLLLYYPGIAKGQSAAVTSHLDIMPTVLELAGLPIPTGLHGSSLLAPAGAAYAFVAHNNQNRRPTKVAVVGKGAKLILDLSEPGRPRLEDLLTPDDQQLRLNAASRDEVRQAAAYAAGLLEASGCLRHRSRSRAATVMPASAPLRACAGSIE